MSEAFLHGVEVVEIDDGPRPLSTVRSSVIGLVGTAPDAESSAAASLTSGTEVGNTGLVWTAATAGAAGNDIRIWLTVPAANEEALAVSVSGTVITVSLETDASGDAVSTAAEVKAAVIASAAAAALVDIDDLGDSTGAGVLTGWPKQLNLAGGLDAALPLNTPVLVTQRTEAARFGTAGTIPAALDAIWDQGGAWVVVVRVDEGGE